MSDFAGEAVLFFLYLLGAALALLVLAVVCVVGLLGKGLWLAGSAGCDLLRGSARQRELDRIVHERNQAILRIVRLHDEGMRRIDQIVARRQITSRSGRQS